MPVEKVQDIVLATCALHNFIKKEDSKEFNAAVDKENTTNLTYSEGTWRTKVKMTDLERSAVNRSNNNAQQVRNDLCRYFNTVGFVNWQWEAVKKFNF